MPYPPYKIKRTQIERVIHRLFYEYGIDLDEQETKQFKIEFEKRYIHKEISEED